MPNPTPYNRTFSFTDFQGSNPSSPLPGVQVDNELENVEAAINGTQTALEDIRRSDGALNNGIVTVDSLSPQVAAGVGAGALASAEAAAASADAASDSAVAAAASATAADGSATAASGYASNALTSRNEASGFSDDATAMAVAAAGYRDFAAAWATAAEGVDVDDGVNPVGKSSYHWAQVALGAATGALPDGSVSTSKIVDGAVTTTKIADGDVTLAKLATDVTDAIDAKADATDTTTALAAKLDKSGGVMTGAIQDATLASSAAPTKKLGFDLAAITAGQTRTITMPDANVDLSGLNRLKWETLGSVNLSGVPTAEITGLMDPTRYSRYRLMIDAARVATDGTNLNFEVSTDNGSSWLTTSIYSFVLNRWTNAATSQGGAVNAGAGQLAQTLSNAEGNELSGDLIITKSAGQSWRVRGPLEFTTTTSFLGSSANIKINTTLDINAIRFRSSSGNLAVFTATLEGYRT